MPEHEKSHPFYVWSGIFTPKHMTQTGPALGLFFWCIEKTTFEEFDVGYVCGGDVIPADYIRSFLGGSRDTITRNLQRLQSFGYVDFERTNRGYRITVMNSKRWKKPPKNSKPDTADMRHQTEPDTADMRHQTEPDTADMRHRHNIDRASNQLLKQPAVQATTNPVLPNSGSTTESEVPAENPKPEKAFEGFFEFVKIVNGENGDTGTPVGAQREQVAALLDQWGMARMVDVAKEQAPAMDHKTWGYRIAVLRNHAAPKPPDPSCPMCGHRREGCKRLRTLANFRNYSRITNASIQVEKWVGVPHFFCPICSHRSKAEKGEHERLKAEKESGRPRRSGSGETVSLGEAMREAIQGARSAVGAG